MSFVTRLYCEAAAEAIDAGQLDEAKGYVTLAAMARNPATVAAVNIARETVSKDDWFTLARNHCRGMTDAQRAGASGVLRTLPGYACLADAVAILARL